LPHLYLPQFLEDALPAERTIALHLGQTWLLQSTIVLQLDVPCSSGMAAERQLAVRYGRSVEVVPWDALGHDEPYAATAPTLDVRLTPIFTRTHHLFETSLARLRRLEAPDGVVEECRAIQRQVEQMLTEQWATVQTLGIAETYTAILRDLVEISFEMCIEASRLALWDSVLNWLSGLAIRAFQYAVERSAVPIPPDTPHP